jgi:hypothetical protein
MRLLKIIITVFFIAYLANVNVCYNAAFQKEKSDSENKQLITSDFENVISAVILSRENQTGRKATNPTGLPKLTLIASDYFSAKNKFPHVGNFEPPYVTVNGINEHTLVSLHCLLTV